MNKTVFKIALILVAALGPLLWVFNRPLMTQPQDYHLFVDTRSFWGIPNALDVLSNLAFLLAGYLGLNELIKHQSNLITRRSWTWFFLSILLIAPGSAYYHWAPNDATLVWDRLPMSMGFMALYIVLLCEHISIKLERWLYVGMLLGISSVIVWVMTSDLRFYYWVQFSSFITIPLILSLFPSRFTMKIYYVICLVIYGLAKWAEVKDREIFIGSGELISGHTLKHFLAAMGLMALWWMVKTRKESLAAAKTSMVEVSHLTPTGPA
jgi:hypothetical protein